MLDISLKQMRYAVEIAQCGSINQAAQNLYVTQSSLSKAMKELENVLGYAVFQRTPAGTAVTEEGQSFLELAHQIVYCTPDRDPAYIILLCQLCLCRNSFRCIINPIFNIPFQTLYNLRI